MHIILLILIGILMPIAKTQTTQYLLLRKGKEVSLTTSFPAVGVVPKIAFNKDKYTKADAKKSTLELTQQKETKTSGYEYEPPQTEFKTTTHETHLMMTKKTIDKPTATTMGAVKTVKSTVKSTVKGTAKATAKATVKVTTNDELDDENQDVIPVFAQRYRKQRKLRN